MDLSTLLKIEIILLNVSGQKDDLQLLNQNHGLRK